MRRKIKICVLLIIIICFIIWPTAFWLYYKNRVLPGVYLGSISLANIKKENIPEKINKIFSEFSQNDFVFKTETAKETRTINLPFFLTSSLDPSLSRPLFSFDLKATVEKVYKAGRSEKFWENYKTSFTRFKKIDKIEPVFFLDYGLEEELKYRFSDLETPPQEAAFSYENGQIKIIPESVGFVLNYKEAVQDFENNIKKLKNELVEIKNQTIVPIIKKEEAEELAEEISSLISARPNFFIKIEENNYELNLEEWLKWIEFYKEDEEIKLRLNKEKVISFLGKIAEQVNQAPSNARFVVDNGRVVEFKLAQKGKEIDLEKAYFLLNEDIFDSSREFCQIDLKEVPPSYNISDINNLGIKELVARGESNFAGSPINRRHNIKVGAEKIQGILIAPDEEFSLVEAIGEVSDKAGFLPELVIKGDRTVPEFGGGLCQLGTTAFRLALNAGLPITERVPHSYRVVYYEPAGMDATIYQPHPDLRFINDTDSFLLLQTKIEGDNLIFEFYGTSDGRKVIITPPVLEDITPPGPAKYIETTDLLPGQKKKLESAHNGAKAHFKRKVIFKNGIEREETWYSYYVPWPEVWLVGAEPKISEELKNQQEQEGTENQEGEQEKNENEGVF